MKPSLPLPDNTVAPEVPADAYGPDFFIYSLHTDFRTLCRHIGFERAREEMAVIINMEAEGRQRPHG